MKEEALKELLYKMADDQLILGHRNSEWTGMGPILEEDIAFSSMAQDKIGHCYTLYGLLHDLGEADPDTIAFTRNADQFHNCQFVELPIGEYDFSIIRHLFFDFSEYLRFDLLSASSFEPLAQAARKFTGELRYHTMHAKVFVEKVGNSAGEGVDRLQESLNYAFPYALGIFEESRYEEDLKAEGIWVGENILKEKWLESISDFLSNTLLELPDHSNVNPENGGRKGVHTEHLQPLLDEMSEVFKIDPAAEW